jgi:16S rRNA (cytosine967-C5)-methyltransferase
LRNFSKGLELKRASASDSKGCRELAAEILLKVEGRNAYADVLLDHSLKQAALSVRDRALLTQLVYGTLRWRGNIDWHLSQPLTRPLSKMDAYLRNLLRLTLYQLLFLEKIPDYAAVYEAVELAKNYGGKRAGGLVNAVTRAVLRQKDKLRYPDPDADIASYLAVALSHPEWLVRRWLKYFGPEATEALLKANNEEAPLTLRVSRLKGDREELLKMLRDLELEAAPTRFSPQGIKVKGASAPDLLPGFREGLFQVQGEASQLIGYLVDPKRGERVLDACAAPGGKSTHLAELMEDRGEIVATDISARGLEKLKQSMQRLALKSVRPFRVDMARGWEKAVAGSFDRILVDAPCSGLGTLRSHPEAKWRRDERDIERLSRLQEKILSQLPPHLTAGGILVYATCTLTREENERVVENFLARQRDFVLEDAASYLPEEARSLACGNYFLALPHKHDTDGFFAVRMRKIA